MLVAGTAAAPEVVTPSGRLAGFVDVDHPHCMHSDHLASIRTRVREAQSFLAWYATEKIRARRARPPRKEG